jgi:hypothetical protein
VDTFLTLVIALGGIATGIGAIWTAMLARRQLDEQRRFLEEQNEIARSQARLTEQSLAEQRRSFQEQTEIAARQSQLTERSLVEQNERAREENERARLSFEVDMTLRLEDRWDSPAFRNRRRKWANHIKEHFFADDDVGLLEVEHMDESTREPLLNFYELLGDLVGKEVLRPQTVWNRFGLRARATWALLRPAIEKMREEAKDPTLLEDFERLDALMAEVDRERGVGEEYIGKKQLRYYVELESRPHATGEGGYPSSIPAE